MTLEEGVYAAAVTPRRPSGRELDLGASLELVDYLGATGVRGIVLLGATGEFPHLELEERMRLASLATRRSRVPVIVNITHSTLAGSIALAEEAAGAGVAALMLMPPYFYRYDQPEVIQFYTEFADSLRARIPVLLYNIPVFTNPIEPGTAIELLASGRFAGIKDSSGSLEYFAQLKDVCGRQNLPFIVGHDGVFARARSEGAHGVISGVSCVVPELLLALETAASSGDHARRDRLDVRLQEFLGRIDRFPGSTAIREALAVRGITVGPQANPLGPEAARQLAEFREWFQAWLPVVQDEVRHEEGKLRSTA